MAVSWGCHDDVPQTGQLRTTGSYSLTDLEARSPKSRYQQYTLPLKPVRESPSPPASGGEWLRHPVTWTSSPCVSLCPLLMKTADTG